MSCDNTAKQIELTGIDKLFKDYELQPTEERAKVLLDSLDGFIAEKIEDKSFVKPYLEKGIDISIAHGNLSRTPGYLLPLLRNYPNLDNRKKHLLSLGDVMYTLRKRHASNIIYKNLRRDYPNDNDVVSKSQLIDSLAQSQPDYLEYLFEQMKLNPDQLGINRNASLTYVDAVEAHVLSSPKDTLNPTYLFQASAVAKSLRTLPKAMTLYDWIIQDYPNHDKGALSLFLKAFTLEQDYKRFDESKVLYQDFLAKYPNHRMAEGAKFLLENLGKSVEESVPVLKSNK